MVPVINVDYTKIKTRYYNIFDISTYLKNKYVRHFNGDTTNKNWNYFIYNADINIDDSMISGLTIMNLIIFIIL